MSMKRDINILIDKLCAEQGFCLSPQVVKDILLKDHISADEFTKYILMGEGMDPSYELEHFRNIKKKFTDIFGNEVSERDY
jgi:hypothetical protein